jgi:hypothetical protein
MQVNHMSASYGAAGAGRQAARQAGVAGDSTLNGPRKFCCVALLPLKTFNLPPPASNEYFRFLSTRKL